MAAIRKSTALLKRAESAETGHSDHRQDCSIVHIGVAYTARIDRTVAGEIVNEQVSNQVN